MSPSVDSIELSDPNDRRVHVIAAAQAAASWVRTRRTIWAPGLPPSSVAAREVSLDLDQAAAKAVEHPRRDVMRGLLLAPPVPAPPRVVPLEPREVGRTRRLFEQTIKHRIWMSPLVRRRAPAAAAAAIVLTAGVTMRSYWIDAATTSMSKAKPWIGSQPADRTRSSASVTEDGTLNVQSDPPGAQVMVDGKPRGVTPLMLSNIASGAHVIALTSPSGSVRRVVQVKAHETAQVSEMMFGGWAVVYAPFDVVVRDGTAVVLPDDRGQILLSAGSHSLSVENQELGYTATRRVDIRPGEVTTVSLTPSESLLSVVSSEPANVWVDGVLAGPAPLARRPIDLGTREIIVKNAAGAERRFVVVATTKGVDLNVKF